MGVGTSDLSAFRADPGLGCAERLVSHSCAMTDCKRGLANSRAFLCQAWACFLAKVVDQARHSIAFMSEVKWGWSF